MRKTRTGEPCAAEPHARFGGRGGLKPLPTPIGRLLVILIVAAALAPAASRAANETVRIGWLSQAVKRTLPLSYLDQPPQDEGIQGARLGVADNETTGHFTDQSFTLTETIVPEDGDLAAGLHELAAKGIRLVVTDLAAPELLSAAGMPEAAGLTFFDAGSADDRLRGEDCRANILHLLPSRAMLADALVQYLVAKRWQSLLLIVGHSDGDRELAGDPYDLEAVGQGRAGTIERLGYPGTSEAGGFERTPQSPPIRVGLQGLRVPQLAKDAPRGVCNQVRVVVHRFCRSEFLG